MDDDASGARSTNEMTGAEAMVRMLQAHDVTHVFGLCGDTTLPFYDAMARLDHGITHILTRDERHAAYMADGYARVTGKPGVCEGPSGGGATYILPGVVEANESSIPILAITTDVATTSRGRYPLTELDQVALFRPLTKWNASLDRAGRLPAMMRTAFRAMTTGRPGAVHLALPFDTQKAAVDSAEIWADPRHRTYPAEPSAPEPEAVRAAADALVSARSAIAICGGGPVIAGAAEPLARLARMLDIPVATTVSGQGAIAETDPQALGVVGSNGGHPATRAAVDAADLVVFIGCRAGSVTTERWRSPGPGGTVIHIDSDPMVIGANYRTDIAIVADARLALEALVAEIETRERPRAQNGAARAKAAMGREARRPDASRGKRRDPDPAGTGHRHPVAPARRGRGRRGGSGHPLPLCLGAVQVAPRGAALHLQPRAWRAGLRARRGDGGACRAAGRQDRGTDGRWVVRVLLRRVRDDGAAPDADHRDRVFERVLRLDQGRARLGLRQAILQRGLHPHRPRRGGRGLRCPRLAGRGARGPGARAPGRARA